MAITFLTRDSRYPLAVHITRSEFALRGTPVAISRGSSSQPMGDSTFIDEQPHSRLEVLHTRDTQYMRHHTHREHRNQHPSASGRGVQQTCRELTTREQTLERFTDL